MAAFVSKLMAAFAFRASELAVLVELLSFVGMALVTLMFAAAFAPAPVRRAGHGLVLKSVGVKSTSLGARAGEAAGRADLEAVNDNEIRLRVARASGAAPRLRKRIFDIAAALGLLLLFAPLLALTALLIRLDSRGPALYRQKRVGLDGKVFEIFKFRSMRIDAEKDGARWASADDDRITRVGRFIRRTRIDEIPQAFNILRGEMSFIGPRPERPEFVSILEREIPHYHNRHFVKPGITGWAQVKHEYTASVDGARTKLAYDLFYVNHSSLLLDCMIILMTVRVALLGIGSR